MLHPDQSLSQVALTYPAASRVFRRHRLDFCCGGQRSIRDACAARQLDAQAVLDEISATQAPDIRPDVVRLPLAQLITHILVHYHEAHRRELPDLVELARKVERVHADKAAVPRGLADHLAQMRLAMETHMQKEEMVLFPAVLRGVRANLSMPIQVMEAEHDDHGQSLALLRELAHEFVAPPEACTSWKALYLRCEQLEADIMAHVHLENHVLFPRVLEGAE